MINLALMCGSDYTQGVQGIGPVSALEVLAEFPGDGLQPLKNLKSDLDVILISVIIRADMSS